MESTSFCRFFVAHLDTRNLQFIFSPNFLHKKPSKLKTTNPEIFGAPNLATCGTNFKVTIAWWRLVAVSLLVFFLHSGAVCLGILDPKKAQPAAPNQRDFSVFRGGEYQVWRANFKTYPNSKTNQNPSWNFEMVNITLFAFFFTSQVVVWDYFHQL